VRKNVGNMKDNMKKLFKRLLGHKLSIYDLIEDVRSELISNCSMVLHIGAHEGIEAKYYSCFDKQVFWFEGNPRIFAALEANIKPFGGQKAFLALLGFENDKVIQFNIASNNGHSSSVLQFGKDMNHEGLTMVESLELKTSRLDSLLSDSEILVNSHWVVDVQGFELQVLKGAGTLIDRAYSMEIEVSTKEEYIGGAQYQEIYDFMKEKGFTPLWQPKIHSHEDIFFVRRF
jgi:FkbM family methyltransferase